MIKPDVTELPDIVASPDEAIISTTSTSPTAPSETLLPLSVCVEDISPPENAIKLPVFVISPLIVISGLSDPKLLAVNTIPSSVAVAVVALIVAPILRIELMVPAAVATLPKNL